jgi:hypothetical protein
VLVPVGDLGWGRAGLLDVGAGRPTREHGHRNSTRFAALGAVPAARVDARRPRRVARQRRPVWERNPTLLRQLSGWARRTARGAILAAHPPAAGGPR